ncbi:unnamed protein product [Zymoseptoria tritici ST99CH_1A5]|uniref:NAD(P)-binding protein n=4 Tax=Zymoseptoria tritici TaxID=1047171 RepID=F9XJ00_ZYMTI|nr:uncharacterized protein MYCGRDRAFT_101134 [Zymoseptoria tritici IPO323]SMQ53820.1 unnamed protein product [Zymoseptoria tritici ST99CH_3D7]SMR58261.1 unnamed protein product [Zymoseptoria tritici ST99CH_1E4]SMR61234.1 unnamed protein product [Zymoseptoria tritici ST99CH_3D1]SMY27457.1 unnamed protein product [Zymoseptoria tritici ST99CH_1A5]EGP84264.1 hypothetical protein MYCGRDRAFT_101134 [Zymoseptoria tritici IPO323]
MSAPIAIIAGVGPGTGAAVARRFAKAYPVVLLARKPANFESLAEEINKSGGQAIGISTDVSSEESMKNAFNKIKEKFGQDVKAAAAVFNASGSFTRKPFLELSTEEFEVSYQVSVKGAFLFSRHTLPLLLPHVQSTGTPNVSPPTLIFTGATASIKSNAQMSSFSTGKFALRALSTSLAKEFGPQGVHVAHAVIDGVIDIERTKGWLVGQPAEAKIGADDIAEVYWGLHGQGRRGWVNEVDVRPMLEKW